MAIEDIVKALGDNSNLIDEVNSLYGSSTSNVDRINTLEVELNDAINRRKKLHSTVAEATGLTELSKDNLMKFAANADEGLLADKNTLQGQLAELQSKYDGLDSAHESEISEMLLKDTLRGLDIRERVQNDKAFSELTKLVLNGAQRDGVKFTFKEDGKTLFGSGGKPLSIEDRITQIQDSEYSYLFKPMTGAGGGSKPSFPANRTATSDNDRAAQMARKIGL